jgi:hypothetical protein
MSTADARLHLCALLMQRLGHVCCAQKHSCVLQLMHCNCTLLQVVNRQAGAPCGSRHRNVVLKEAVCMPRHQPIAAAGL